MKKLKHDVASTGQKFDVILVPGDFVAHGISIDPTDTPKPQSSLSVHSKMKLNIQRLLCSIRQKFPFLQRLSTEVDFRRKEFLRAARLCAAYMQ